VYANLIVLKSVPGTTMRVRTGWRNHPMMRLGREWQRK
jgi:hypothetical protein